MLVGYARVSTDDQTPAWQDRQAGGGHVLTSGRPRKNTCPSLRQRMM
jgi:hypothetical protein